MDIVPVSILTFRRPRYLAQTIDSFVEKNASCLSRFSIRVLVQGGRHEETAKALETRASVIDQVKVVPDNPGGGFGFSRCMEWFVGKHPYAIYLEDDWRSDEGLVTYVDEMIQFLDQHPKIGQIRLRSFKSQVSRFNLCTQERIAWERITPHLLSGNAHFTLNPSLIRTSILPRILPVKNEKEACWKYHSLGLDCAQLDADCFNHIGAERATAERAVV